MNHMQSHKSPVADGGRSFEYIDENLREQRRKILSKYKQNPDIEMSSRDARLDGVDSPKYHLDKLEAWGLLEVTGSKAVGAGADAHLFSLTEKGEEYLIRLDETPGVDTEELEDAVVGLQSRMGRLESEVDRLRSELEQTREERDALELNFKALTYALDEIGVDVAEPAKRYREENR